MQFPYESAVLNDELPMFLLMPSVKYIAMHWHDRIEFVYVLKGRVRTFIGKEEFILQENDLIFINSNEVHGVESNEENRLLILQIPISFIKNYYGNIENEYFHCYSINAMDQFDYDFIRSSMIKLMLNLKQKQSAYEIKIHSLLLDIIYQLLTKFVVKNHQEVHGKNEKNKERLTRITQYLEEKFMYPLTLNEIAKKENLSPPYLSRYFQQHIGQSFVKYLNSIRLEHAVRYLIETNWTILEISMESGFTNLNTFHKLFKETFHTTPYKYRKEHQTTSKNSFPINKFGIKSYQYNEEYDLDWLSELLKRTEKVKNLY